MGSHPPSRATVPGWRRRKDGSPGASGQVQATAWLQWGTLPLSRLWGLSFPGPWQRVGPRTIPHCTPPLPASPYSHSPFSGVPGLTVTFLPERPARPTLAEVALPAEGPSRPFCPPSNPTSRAATKTKEVMAFLCPLLLWGEEGESPEPLRWESPQLSPLPPQLYTGCSPTTHQASLSAPLALSSGAAPGRWFILPPSPSPQCLLGSSPPAAASGEKQPPSSFSPSLLPPFFLPPCLCQVPPLSQASEQPWRQEGHVKSFFTVLRRQRGEDSGGGSGTISSLL